MTLVQQKAQLKLQDYRLLLYRRSIHPEFFDVVCSRTVHQDDYDLEVLLSHGSHMLSVQHAQQWVVEVVTPESLHYPTRGLMATIPCAGERDHEVEFGTMFRYLTTVQTEVVPPAVYRDTLREMRAFACSEQALVCEWQDEGEEDHSMSVVDYQRFVREVHIQTWHLDASCGLIVRSQGLFELGG
ncbi:MAG: DUF2617 family protein [Planctomycetes bacterium]|nr:DUF2617 family protein [Planctomycetota bacterium]